MKRRNFIVLSALAAGAVSVPFFNCAGPDPELDKKLAIPQTLASLLDENSIKAIGKKYGSSYPGEYSIRTLEQQLVKYGDGKSVSSNTPAKEIYSVLNAHIQDDFESADTLVLDGWVLSLTEARQCALFSLIRQSK